MDWKLLLQLAGVALGLLYLWLEYRADIRLWVVGLVMPIVHGVLYYKSGLYADCAMNGYYVLAGLYGLAVWRRAPREKGAQLRIGQTPAGVAGRLLGIYLLLHAAIYLLLVRFTNSTVPFWDSLTTALSIVAMWMLSRKYVEQWLVWLAVDVITVGYGYEGYQSAYAAYINGSGVCRCIFTAKGKHTGSKGSDPVHDSRHQSGKCFRYRNRAGRKNLTQRYFSKGTGDPGSSCSKWPDGCSKGRRQCSP